MQLRSFGRSGLNPGPWREFGVGHSFGRGAAGESLPCCRGVFDGGPSGFDEPAPDSGWHAFVQGDTPVPSFVAVEHHRRGTSPLESFPEHMSGVLVDRDAHVVLRRCQGPEDVAHHPFVGVSDGHVEAGVTSGSVHQVEASPQTHAPPDFLPGNRLKAVAFQQRVDRCLRRVEAQVGPGRLSASEEHERQHRDTHVALVPWRYCLGAPA